MPGEFYGGAWDGTAGWPHYEMSVHRAEYYDSVGANVGPKLGKDYTMLDVDILDQATANAALQFVQQQFNGYCFIR